ncbi:MAG: response regulator [Oligoflexales bacterium]|nr:response regulator [Oligoflexales bacterium]
MDYAQKEILIVEDSESLLKCMLEGIKNFDFKFFKCSVDGAINGQEGLEKALHKQYDLIITDMKMPEKNGPEFIREIRNISTYEKTPIVFMSGYFRITPSDSYESYAEDLIFLDKPFSMKKIRNILKILFIDRKKIA